MIKKAIVAIVVIVAAAAIVFAALPADQKSSTNSNSANSDIQQKPANNTTIADNNMTSKTDVTAISAEEAKKIAGKYINEPGAIAGTPKLSKQNGNLVYIVPVIYNGKIAGEIDIDAQSGKNVGGAGGAP